jgi:hypothetical protein
MWYVVCGMWYVCVSYFLKLALLPYESSDCESESESESESNKNHED